MTATQPPGAGPPDRAATGVFRSALRVVRAPVWRLLDALRRARERRRLRWLARGSGDPFRRSPYYARAEPHTDRQWDTLVWPRIRTLDFSRTLELAPGHGRHSVRLRSLATELTLVDINEECLRHCRRRLGDDSGSVRYLRTDGYSLDGVDDATITTVFTFDSMVHFDRRVVAAYLREFARVLEEGGHAFCHHSNHQRARRGDFRTSEHWRNFMSLELFASLARAAGLEVLRSDPIDWGEGEELCPQLDGLTLLQRPPAAARSS